MTSYLFGVFKNKGMCLGWKYKRIGTLVWRSCCVFPEKPKDLQWMLDRFDNSNCS